MRKLKFETGKIYHIYNRGVEKRVIFTNDSDYWRFLQALFLFNDEDASRNLLWELERQNGKLHFGILKKFVESNNMERKPLVKILAYCLMPNHFHLVVEEIEEGGITKFMHRLGVGYSMYFNKKYERVGVLFQGRYKAALVEDDLQLQYLLVYINVLNPGQIIEPKLKENGVKNVEAILNFAKTYWCTHLEYLDERESIIIEKGILGELFRENNEYENFVKDILEGKKINKINKLTFEN